MADNSMQNKRKHYVGDKQLDLIIIINILPCEVSYKLNEKYHTHINIYIYIYIYIYILSRNNMLSIQCLSLIHLFRY